MALGRMRRGREFGRLAVFCLLWASLPALGGDQTAYLENRLLKEELALAKTPSLYFVVYAKSKKIAPKSRGMILQERTVQGMHA